MTRALSCLLHGQAAQAIAFNRGSVVLLPLLLLWAGAAVYAVLSKTVAREEAGA